jgi:hypothetical protein
VQSLINMWPSVSCRGGSPAWVNFLNAYPGQQILYRRSVGIFNNAVDDGIVLLLLLLLLLPKASTVVVVH